MKDNTVKRVKKPGIAGIVIIIIALALVCLIYYSNKGTHYLMLPLIIFLSFILLRKIIALILTGSFVKTLCSILVQLAAGISVSLFFINAQGEQDVHTIGIYILLITSISAFYRIMAYIASGRIYLRALIKSLSFLSSGFLTRSLIIVISRNVNGANEFGNVFADLVFAGMVFISICTLFLPAANSKNYYVSIIGRWLGTKLPVKFILFMLAASYFSIVKPYMQGNIYLALVEWLILSLLCIVLFYISMKRVKSIVQKMPSREWTKHRQMIVQNPGQELLEISSYIDDFIERNNKNKFLIAVIEEGLSKELTYEQIDTIINDFINYQDEPIPGMVTKWRKHQIEIKNRTNREIILADLIEKLKNTNISMKL